MLSALLLLLTGGQLASSDSSVCFCLMMVDMNVGEALVAHVDIPPWQRMILLEGIWEVRCVEMCRILRLAM